jgi:hypothetical protein
MLPSAAMEESNLGISSDAADNTFRLTWQLVIPPGKLYLVVSSTPMIPLSKYVSSSKLTHLM